MVLDYINVVFKQSTTRTAAKIIRMTELSALCLKDQNLAVLELWIWTRNIKWPLKSGTSKSDSRIPEVLTYFQAISKLPPSEIFGAVGCVAK